VSARLLAIRAIKEIKEIKAIREIAFPREALE
jgi:hypothetical protein